MPKKRPAPAEPPPLPPPIEPRAVYDLRAAQYVVGAAAGTLPREIKLKRLRAAKRGGRTVILGKWLLKWVEDGEVRPAPDDPGPN